MKANSDAIRRSVVFIHRVDKLGQLKEAGTGFLLLAPLKSDHTRGYLILVTARHIADPTWAGCPATDDALMAVFNKKSYDPTKDTTGTVEARLGSDWVFPDDDSVDIAVTVVFPEAFAALDTEAQGLAVSELPSPEDLKRIGSGSPIISAGLLLGASGTKRNYPIFKFGFVSSVPDEKVAVSCCAGCATKLQTQWMIAASLVPGNSGSPIIYMPGPLAGGGRPFLLGVQSTSFLGSDIAGMAPAQYLLEIIRKLNLSDVDLAIPGMPEVPAQAHPTSASPSTPVPGPLPQPR